MLQTLKNAWKIEDLRRKIIFTFLMLLVFRAGSHIPVPGIDTEQIRAIIDRGALFGFFDFVSGGAFANFTIFAMSITPYINASIIMQLLIVVIPKLEQLAKEGEEGRKVIAQYIRYLTVTLAFIQAIGMSFGFRGAVIDHNFASVAIIVLSLTAGTAFLMWLGEQITDKGIGNGISLIIFAGIISRLPMGSFQLFQMVRVGTTSIFAVILLGIVGLLVIAGVVAVQQGQRRIPVQYAKRVVGRKMYGGQSTHIPLKVNQAGVIPVIFAMSILLFPSTIAGFFPGNRIASAIGELLQPGGFVYAGLYAVLIIFFTYFYTAITFNPADVANNMKKNGGFVPGIRPGKPTAQHIQKILSRITLAGALFLATIAVMPYLLTGLTTLEIYFGGTALLIVCGVALETMKQVESQMLMRHYEGFMK